MIIITDICPHSLPPPVVPTSIYDAVGNRVAQTHRHDAATVDGSCTLTHDGAGRVIGLVSPANDTVAIGHDAAHRPDRLPNEITSTVVNNEKARPVSITDTLGALEVRRLTHGLDGERKITSIAEETRGPRHCHETVCFDHRFERHHLTDAQ